MRKLLLGLFVATLAASARANPMLDKCLPFAPPVCGLTDKSAQAEFLSCFAAVQLAAGKAGDIPKLCAGVKPGENRTMNCLRKNTKQLGADCRKALKDYDAIAAPKPEAGGKKKGRHAGVAATRG